MLQQAVQRPAAEAANLHLRLTGSHYGNFATAGVSHVTRKDQAQPNPCGNTCMHLSSNILRKTTTTATCSGWADRNTEQAVLSQPHSRQRC
jgi:hypothetical protein